MMIILHYGGLGLAVCRPADQLDRTLQDQKAESVEAEQPDTPVGRGFGLMIHLAAKVLLICIFSSLIG